ncbi:MAG: phosphoribosylaminoimidazolesuccinocarboxamide synthase [Verrucomicrobiota bacterium]|nr:phosphoribosylaminoimidazolesuccinocarboxamide synthase [Verrucomicrobiota bacterium]
MDLFTIDLPGARKVASGKVREIFDLGEHLLLVATDRISAFDCVLPDPIPYKGAVLNSMSAFWFGKLDFVENHLVATEPVSFAPELQPFAAQLRRRAMIVRKARPLPVECVVRGYLAGSGWKEYQQAQSICGIPLPPGLRQAERLPEPLFTPSTKAPSGHDQNISWDECRRLIGPDLAEQVRALSLRVYGEARFYAEGRGIIVADTKLEFGLLDGRLILIDEVLTPDSSRFWPADQHRLGISPPSFDKQFVRDYLETLAWDKTPPAPPLPADIVRKTSEKYLEAYARLTGVELGR